MEHLVLHQCNNVARRGLVDMVVVDIVRALFLSLHDPPSPPLSHIARCASSSRSCASGADGWAAAVPPGVHGLRC